MPWLVTAAAFAAISGCAPTLDWRDVRADHLSAQLPCRPSVQARTVEIEGRRREMNLLSCSAGASTWALAWVADVAPAELAAVTDRLRGQALSNVGGQVSEALALRVPGATPNAASGRWRTAGRRPDGSALTQDMAVFSRGTTVFQATVLSTDARGEGVDHFFGALSFAG